MTATPRAVGPQASVGNMAPKSASARHDATVGASCAADIHTYRTKNMSDPMKPSLPLARFVGERLGAKVAEERGPVRAR